MRVVRARIFFQNGEITIFVYHIPIWGAKNIEIVSYSMKKYTIFFLLMGIVLSLRAQISIPLPQIIAPSNHIYLSPTGDDSNPGTLASPKKTFQAALDAFPFGVAGVNNSQSYNEIVFLAGDYYPTQTLSQTPSQFLQTLNGNKLYKNVSLRGKGKVVIHGDNAQNVGYSALVALMGSHIFVRNITLQKSNYGGIKFLGGARHASHIFVDSLKIDDAKSHGCLFTLVDTIWVKNSIVTNTCNESSDETTSNCQWGSALKTEFCKNITFEHNLVYRNWGEGINTSLSEGIYCSKNIAYDNYSVNFYLHSASKGVWEGNLVYNEDSAFWRGCYNNGKRNAPGGFSIANELTCTYACVGGGNNQNCGGKYHCCAFDAYDIVGYQTYPYRQTDSIFVYNNVILQADISIWDAFSGFLNYGFIKDIFIENNTLVGLSGRNTANKIPIACTLGTSFVYAQNILIQNNIFTQDTSQSNFKKGLSVYIPSGTCNTISPANLVHLSNNRWNMSGICSNSSVNTSTEQILTTLPTYILPTQISQLVPNLQQSYWVQSATPSAYITKDYYGNPRTMSSNVGAFEKGSVNALSNAQDDASFRFFPNPALHTLNIENESADAYVVRIVDVQGKLQLLTTKLYGKQVLDVSALNQGYYILIIEMEEGRRMMRKLWIRE